MTTQYTPILKLALPVTGELSGTWGDVVNDNITSMVEQAVAGLATISTWTANSHTLTTANGTTSESRCAMLVAQNGAGLAASGEIVCPASSKLYVLKNDTSYQITLKTASGTGVAVASGNTAFLFCDGTNVNACVTTIVDGRVTGNLTVDGNATVNGNTTLGNATSDTITATARFASGLIPSADNTYDLGSTANSWKDLYIDGTATMALVAISGGTINGVSIGGTTPATFLAVDNLSLDGNTIASTNTNGNIVIAPNGTGDVQLDADTVRVGDAGAAATLTSNGAGALTVTTGGAADLTLSTNSGTTSGTITIANGANGNITLTPNGTGDVILSADTTQIGDSNTDAYLTTNGTGNLNLTTNNGTNSGTIQIAQGANGNITLTPNGTGLVSIPSMTLSGGTANGVAYLNGSKVLTTGSALTFNGSDSFNFGGSSASAYNTFGVNNTASNGFARMLLNIGSSGANGVGAVKYAPGIFFAIGTDSDSSSTPMVFNLGNASEQMRLTSTGLGIGTSSPGAKLGVQGAANASAPATSSAISIRANNGGAVSLWLSNYAYQYSWMQSIQDDGTNNIKNLVLQPLGGGVGIGANPATTFQVNAAAPTIRIEETTTGGSKRLEMGVTSGGQAFIGANQSAQSLALQTVGSTRVTIGSTGNVTVAGDGYLDVVNGYVRAGGGSDQGTQLTMWTDSGGDAALAAYTLRFNTGNNSARTERMRMNNLGQLGVGTTSFQAGSPAGSISFASGASLQTGSFGRAWNPAQQIGQAANAGLYGMAQTYLAYYDSGWKSLGGGTASAITLDEGIFSFSNTNSVAGGGNSLSWTTRLTSNITGDFGVNTIPSGWGNWTGKGIIQFGNSGAFLHGGGTGWSSGSYVYLGNNGYYNGSNWIYSRAVGASLYAQVDGLHIWSSAPSGSVGATFSYTEQARIDANGNLLVGGTTPFGRLTLYGSGSPSGLLNTYATASSGVRYHAVWYENGTERGSVTSNGGGVVYNSTSDYRMKENVAPMSGALAKVLQLKPCTYTWKNTGSAGEGFIAHELAEVFPNAVTGEKDAVKPDGSIKPQGVDTSMLVAALVSAIQELKAEFDAYKATHP